MSYFQRDLLVRSGVLLSLLFASAISPLNAAELYEEKKVSHIEIVLDCPDPNIQFDPKPLLSKLKTQEGDEFSQVTFDNDLKTLSEQYERVEPIIQMKNGQVVISIHVAPKPIIHKIDFTGNEKFRKSTLQKELEIEPGTIFNRQEFNKAFNKLKDFYFKKGYFEAQLDYSLLPVRNCNEVDVLIRIQEGRPGLIKKIILKGFTKEEQSELLDQMYLKKYNFFTSWITGKGLFRDEALEQDKMTVITFLQNKGYADARVDINLEEDKETGKLIVEITAHRGSQYHIGMVNVGGNELISTEDLLKKSMVTPGDAYSPEKIRESAQGMKDLYGQKGYIDASVQFETCLQEEEPIFDVDFSIDEGQQYKIGLIHIFGNSSTENNVILRESLLVPGETFDSRKLKATQQRLEAVGYFKSVNVYAVRTTDDACLGENYRDVYIEVEETSTGNVSLFVGFSSVDDIFGGLDLTERNFNLAHIGRALRGDISSLRGGGEYFHIRGTAGKKQDNLLLSWLNPYVNDSLWRLGVELSQTYSKLQEDMTVTTYGGSVTTSYPITSFWTVGMRQRLRHSKDNLHLDPLDNSNIAKESVQQRKDELDQKGLISAFSGNLGYDSVDNAYKPHRGWRSYFETEVAGIGGSYVFGKLQYLNSIYFPIWKKGTLKFRADFKYLLPFGKTERKGVPYSERFFLGGDVTMRGYKPFLMGPVVTLQNSSGNYVNTDTPYGGLSSTYLSLEYNQEILRVLDAFVFFDSGSVNFGELSLSKFRATAGGGLRLDIGNRTPIMIGWGYVFCRSDREQHKNQPFFFSMGGQF
ncbi:MAG: outer membrane protein assembly factor BamA [Verrucomicrobiota bacterium]|nr:outer membrane protein assembly factor BamA [Verrucomicrobiota bacterium]